MSRRRVRLLLAVGLAAAAAPAIAATAEIKYVLQCGNAKSVPPDDDSDPVLLTRIVAIANGESQNGEIYIRHFVASGENYTRNKQYRDLRFWSEGNADYWSGTSVKYPDRTMVGRIGIHSKRQWIEYVEKHYQGGKLESTTTFACRPIKPEIRDEDWKEGGKEVIKHLTFGGVDLHAWIGDNSTRCVTLVRADTASAYAIVTKGPNGRPQKPRVGGSGRFRRSMRAVQSYPYREPALRMLPDRSPANVAFVARCASLFRII